ncbi:hypothetical protein F7C95_17575 [Opitutia bacterium ISCC 51]|nr:hypothetical protein F7C95_17575 [Opitutae bacterium ISCC 51]QXD27782.1 hypothetical protein GA003_17480 [Opitutae bacterium ISCC 52]
MISLSNLLSLVLLLFLLSLQLNGENRVVVRAQATKKFIQARSLNEGKKIQTYQFMQGQYFPGNVRRDTMEEIPFMSLLENVAEHLQIQSFYPNPEFGEGDLVIVVHYGATDVGSSFQEAFGQTSLSDFGYDGVRSASSE